MQYPDTDHAGPFTALCREAILAPTFNVGVSENGHRRSQRPVHGPSRCRGFSRCLGGVARLRALTTFRTLGGSSRYTEKTRERVSRQRGPAVDPDVNVGASIGAEKGRERPSSLLLLPRSPFHGMIAHLRAQRTRTGLHTVLSVGNCQPQMGRGSLPPRLRGGLGWGPLACIAYAEGSRMALQVDPTQWASVTRRSLPTLAPRPDASQTTSVTRYSPGLS